jgi:hypothetical protein
LENKIFTSSVISIGRFKEAKSGVLKLDADLNVIENKMEFEKEVIVIKDAKDLEKAKKHGDADTVVTTATTRTVTEPTAEEKKAAEEAARNETAVQIKEETLISPEQELLKELETYELPTEVIAVVPH